MLKKMAQLGYDDVIIDGMVNVIGIIGYGAQKILFDSHIDTVTVEDEEEWSVPPFDGEIIDGDEHYSVTQMMEACKFYIHLVDCL